MNPSEFRRKTLLLGLSILLSLFAITFTISSLNQPVFAQATIQSGSIQGTVTDPSGAVVSGAKVTVTNKATGQRIALTTNASGAYNSGSVAPGDYTVRVEAGGFSTSELPTTVTVGNITPGNVKLAVGSASQVVEVAASGVTVNTEQPTVQGVITSAQLENLPMNGRNFMEAAQLEPGVQIQDGGNFDPTKIGYAGISIGGRQGRTTRIEVDGLDITDETVGTTTQNIPAGSIQEFQISQSSLDFSTELTSSGAVNVVTKAGTNQLHGDGFYFFRDKRAGGANFPGGQDLPYQRNDVGFTLGGPIQKDKLFFFIAGERVLQHLFAPVTFSPPFDKLNGGYQSPFKEKQISGKLDYNLFGSAKLFYRFTYDNNTVVGDLLPDYQAFANLDNTPSHAAGLDFNTGTFSHSIRLGYLKFQNHISDGVKLAGAFNPLPNTPIDLRITGISPQFRAGPNHLAPQATFQSDKQIKYDGSKVYGPHIIRYGTSFNRILGGGFAAFYALGPSVRSLASATPFSVFPGGASNPLNYPVRTLRLGNGQGFFTEKPEFGYPAGGQFDNRFQWYLGDTWKIRPNLTLTAGLRYNRDTGRTDSDMAPTPCSAIDSTNFSPAPPCTGNLLDNFGNIPGLGKAVRQANGNYGGTLGFSWDPFKDGKTAIRGGTGLYYENAVFNNVLYDRPVRLTKGLFFTLAPNACPSGVVQFPGGQKVTTTPTGKNIASQICNQPIGSIAADVVALQNAYQAAVKAAGASTNPNFVGETLDASFGGNLYAPNYQTPRSYQMNIGVQREVWKGAVLSADYVRNVSLHYLLGVDSNHVGDSRFFNKTAALNAIQSAVSNCGVANLAAGLVSKACHFDPVTGDALPSSKWRALTIDDLANNGLDSGATYLNGFPAEYKANGLTPDTGAAFPGINPFYGQNVMLFPNGRSVYNGLLFSLRQRTTNLVPFLPGAQFQISYAFSHFNSMAADQDFINNATDFANPNRYFGPTSFDRTHQFSFGTVFTLPKGAQVSFIGHFNSPLPATLTLEDQSRPGEIFHTDVTGDGTNGDVLPGQNIGTFMRGVSPSGLNTVINGYNSTQAGKLTPAGQVVVNSGLITQQQMIALGAVTDTLDPAPAGEVGNDWLRIFDAKFSFPIKIRERVTIDPSVGIYNAFNFANFAISPGNRISGILNGSAGSANGTTYGDQGNRAGLGSGVFQLGAPRQIEFGMRIVF